MSKENKKDPIICPKFWFSDYVRLSGGTKIRWFLRTGIHLEEEATYKVKDRVIVTCNHNAWIEPPAIISLFLSRRIFFVIAENLIKGKKTSWFYKKMNCIVIDREKSDIKAIKEIVKQLNKEHLVVIFPEGKMSEDGTNLDFKNGAALLSLQTNSPILPLYIEPEKKGLWKSHICVGNLINPKEICDGTKSKENQKLITNMIKVRTFELKKRLHEDWKIKAKNKRKKNNN